MLNEAVEGLADNDLGEVVAEEELIRQCCRHAATRESRAGSGERFHGVNRCASRITPAMITKDIKDDPDRSLRVGPQVFEPQGPPRPRHGLMVARTPVPGQVSVPGMSTPVAGSRTP